MLGYDRVNGQVWVSEKKGVCIGFFHALWRTGAGKINKTNFSWWIGEGINGWM